MLISGVKLQPDIMRHRMKTIPVFDITDINSSRKKITANLYPVHYGV